MLALVPKRNPTDPGRGEEKRAGGLETFTAKTEKRFLGPESASDVFG